MDYLKSKSSGLHIGVAHGYENCPCCSIGPMRKLKVWFRRRARRVLKQEDKKKI